MIQTSWLRRAAWLALVCAGLAWPVATSVHRVKQEHRIRTLLLAVQRALQDYHVDQERYIPRQHLAGAEVIAVLSDFGFLRELPGNPWTGVAWKLDGKEPDFLRYETDPNFETYALRALDPVTGQVLLEIDSVKQPSLD